ncbi:MAG TPA: NIPSNAP family protein [Panacibacter sp.]|nr:NIPSNAP family protein [Panacibacter sp.]
MSKTFRKFLFVSLAVIQVSFLYAGKVTGREFYQVTVYHYKNAVQEQTVETYLQNALLPALHRMGTTNIGVFKSLANDTSADKMLYVFMPVKSLEQLAQLPSKLAADKAFQTTGSTYLESVYTNPPYSRMETIILYAFPLAPQMKLPKLSSAYNERVYELRSYESATEKIFQNKVQMFNAGGEISLFKSLNFNAVFYSSVIAGSKMPNLMYMTTFENMADRDAHWKSFGDAPVWKTLSALPEYQNNVSHMDITFLRPVAYSDF